jgi:hypothetical protein
MDKGKKIRDLLQVLQQKGVTPNIAPGPIEDDRETDLLKRVRRNSKKIDSARKLQSRKG